MALRPRPPGERRRHPEVSERNHISLIAYARQPLRETIPRLINLSHGAVVVRTDGLIDPGEPVQVTIYFVESDREVQVEAEVVWANASLGDMALRFVTLSQGGEDAIADFLAARAEKA